MAAAEAGDAKLFNCMDKKTLTMNSECMSKQISSNIAFKKVEESLIQNANQVSDRAIATMTFDPKTLSIEVVAHRDAQLARN
ncbi:pyridine nucleotide transhydrogenase [Glaciecola sp. MH2013]|nr:pyridine nucleotide transhydrogenase [Glaciecola sp. MH2013]